MRPRIRLQNGRWHVHVSPPFQPFGFALMSSAFSYAKAIWKRRKA